MTAVIFWLVQDLLTVLMAGTVRVPEFFLLSLVFRLITCDRSAYVSGIWAAFFGGFLWDLRWVGIPFFTMCYVVVVLVVLAVWNTLPVLGRTLPVIFSLFWSVQLLPAALSMLILERGTGNASLTLFLVQQGTAVPFSLLSAFLYFHYEKNKNA